MTTPSPEAITLAHGSHRTRDGGMCAMEAVAWLAGEPHSDAPACTARPLQRFVIITNDWMGDDERVALKPLLLRLIGTSGSRENDHRAALIFADGAVHEVAPLALDARGKPELAERLRAIAPIVDGTSARAAHDETRAVRADADAAAAAAYAYAAYAADAADAAAADARSHARGEAVDRRIAILDRVLREAYGR